MSRDTIVGFLVGLSTGFLTAYFLKLPDATTDYAEDADAGLRAATDTTVQSAGEAWHASAAGGC